MVSIWLNIYRILMMLGTIVERRVSRDVGPLGFKNR